MTVLPLSGAVLPTASFGLAAIMTPRAAETEHGRAFELNLPLGHALLRM
jgi:hypothetical protein